MYNIETKPFGFKLTFSDFIKADEMLQWVDESKKVLGSVNISCSYQRSENIKIYRPNLPDHPV